MPVFGNWRLVFTKHAEEQRRSREVPLSFIRMVVDDPEITYPDAENKDWLNLVRKVDGKPVRLVVKPKVADKTLIVITVMFRD
jgi:hypothetical protein